MEAVVSGCVGVLTAGCVAGLSASLAGHAGEWRVDGCALEVRRAAHRVAAGIRAAGEGAVRHLERWGVRTPRVERERARIEQGMPEAFAALAISLGSGLSLEQAMRYVGSRAQEPIRSEFLRVSALMACGVAAASALDEMLARLHAPGLRLVALALKVSQRTGAPLAQLLVEASELVGQRLELTRQLDVKTAQVRMSARLVASMPLVMIAFLTLTSSDFRAGIAAPVGAGALVLALTMNMLAWKIMRSLMQVGL